MAAALWVPLHAEELGPASTSALPPKSDTLSSDPGLRRLSPFLRRLARHERRAERAAAKNLLTARRLKFLEQGSDLKVTVILKDNGRNRAVLNQNIVGFGGTVESASRHYLRVTLPLGRLQALAALSGVERVDEPAEAKEHADGMGTRVSESVALTGAHLFQAAGVRGSGIKAAVVDLGFIGFTSTIAAGELPSGTVGIDLSGSGLQTGTVHGTGVAEHLVDMAPDVSLYCLKISDIVSFENAADTLAARGVRVANFSVGWVNQSYYDDSGPVDAVVNASRDNDGIFWTVAAGNDAERHWRGGWSDPDADDYLNFTSTDEGQGFATASSGVSLYLNWNQYDSSATDLDLYVYNKNNNLVASSDDFQNGPQDPVEAVFFNYFSGQAPYYAVVRRFAGPTSNLDMTLFSFTNNLEHAVAGSSLMEPACAHGAFTVGAVNQANWNLATPPPQSYSSHGKTTDGRQKPDIAAPDATTSLTYGATGASGTSFSSPTTAGAAALLLSDKPSRSAEDLDSLLKAWAQDVGPAGADSIYGFGKLYLDSAKINHPPVLAVIGDKTVSEAETLAFSISASDSDGDSVVKTAAGLPTGANFNGTNFSWATNHNDSGHYTVKFIANDGSLADSETIVITVSNVNRPPVLSAIGNKSVNESSALTFAVPASDPDGDTVTKSAVGIPSGSTFDGNTFSWTPGFSDSGHYTVTFVANDGTLADSETVVMMVNNVNRAPVLAAIGNKTVNETQTLTFTVTANDFDGDSVVGTALDLPPGATFNGTVFSWTTAYSDSGHYTMTFIANDGALSDSETIIITVANVNRPPVLSAIGGQSVDEATFIQFSASATDPDGDTAAISANGLPAGSSFDGTTFSWTPGYSDSGLYAVTFIVSDGNLADSESITIAVNNANRPPELSTIGNKAVNEAETLAFAVSGIDTDGDSILLSATGLPSGAVFDGASFSWTPGFSDSGHYSATFIASDGGLSDSETILIAVNNVNRPPVLAGPGETAVDEGALLSFPISANDPDGDSLSLFVAELPTGAVFDGSTLSWTPGFSDSGHYALTLIASDGSAADSETIALTVNNVNRPPVLALIGDQTVDEGDTLEFLTSATDPDGDPVNISATPLPASALFDGSTFSWPAAFTDSGHYALLFVASDGNLNDTQAMTIAVGNINRPPVLTAMPDTSVAENQSIALPVNTTDPDGDDVTLSAVNLPAGASFDGAQLTWTPDFGDSGSYLLTFIVNDSTLSDTTSFTLRVANVNRPPLFTLLIDTTIRETDTLFLPLAALDPDGDSLTLTAPTLPPGAVFDGATLTWVTDYDNAGTYTLTFSANDGILSDSASMVLTVTDFYRPPIFNTVPALTAWEDSLFSDSLTLYFQEPGTAVTYRLLLAPTGMTLDGATGALGWLPVNSQVGAHIAAVEAADPAGAADTVIFGLTVVNTNDPPSLNVAGSEDTIYPGQLYENTLTALDEDSGDSLIFTLVQGPSGVILDPQTGIIQWQPTLSSGGQRFILHFQVTDLAEASAADSLTLYVSPPVKVEARRPPVISSSGLGFLVYPIPQDAETPTLHFQFQGMGSPLWHRLEVVDLFGNSVYKAEGPVSGSGSGTLETSPWAFRRQGVPPGGYLAYLTIVDSVTGRRSQGVQRIVISR